MTLTWTHENPPQWDADKARLIGTAAPGSLGADKLSRSKDGDLLPGDWWRVTSVDEGKGKGKGKDEAKIVGYGWMDSTWGDAEILLFVEAGHRGQGIGTFILGHLEEEARSRGFFYLYNVIPTNHPDAEGIKAWLAERSFSAHADGSFRRSVSRPPRAG